MRSRANQRWQQVTGSLQQGRPEAGLRMVVLAAHPDDETIGASSLLARGCNSQVIYLTDGAPQDGSLWSPDFHGSRQEYLWLRRAEAEKALSLAGVSACRIHWLGGVDQEAIFSAAHLARRLAELADRIDAQVLVTHPYEGGHPDHDAAALLAHLAIHQLCRERDLLLLEMTSYHAEGSRLVTGEFLNPDAAQEIQLHLSDDEQRRKADMFASYASQRRVLHGFSIRCERLRVAPEYDFSRPPHAGKLWYECMAWPMTGQQWRAIALEQIAGVQELSCP